MVVDENGWMFGNDNGGGATMQKFQDGTNPIQAKTKPI